MTEAREHVAVRQVRSYVRRERPLSTQQISQYDALMAQFGTTTDTVTNLARARETILDIGFGDGAALLAMAQAHPARVYVGVEMYQTGILKLLRQVVALGLNNIYVMRADAQHIIQEWPDAHLTAIHLFFPDPWPKARHHKRRLVSATFINEVVRILKPNGLFHMATDWQNYAEEAERVLTACTDLKAVTTEEVLSRPVTKFERRGQRLGHTSYDLRYRKRP